MSEAHVSDLRWDRLLAGELTESDRADALAHAAGCSACAARREEIQAGFDAFANVAPALPRRVPVMPIAAAVFVAAAAVFLIVRAPSSATSGDRTKGGTGPKLMLAAGPRERLAPVMSGDRVRPGDSLQAAYTATRDGFGAVLARDGSGAASAYVPAQGDAMVALPRGTMRSFPGSTILDEVTGAQAVAIVWCETAQPIAPLLGELRATGTVAAPAGCMVERIDLEVRGTP